MKAEVALSARATGEVSLHASAARKEGPREHDDSAGLRPGRKSASNTNHKYRSPNVEFADYSQRAN
jgi:hypothetical protein